MALKASEEQTSLYKGMLDALNGHVAEKCNKDWSVDMYDAESNELGLNIPEDHLAFLIMYQGSHILNIVILAKENTSCHLLRSITEETFERYENYFKSRVMDFN